MGTLLYNHEEPAYHVKNRDGQSRIILTCDHAAHTIPDRLGDLGVGLDVLHSHAGWDIGAFDVSSALADRLDAPLLWTRFSRLVIDCNRPLGIPESIPERIHGETVPGNHGLTPAQRRAREDELFHPYHHAINALIDTHTRRKENIFFLAVHSFTPVLNGRKRPWPIGITYETASAFADFLVRELRQTTLTPVGVNEPYPITRNGDYGMHAHGARHDTDAVLMEIRQDLLENQDTKNTIIDDLTEILGRFANLTESRG